ncbi:PAS/PAC sensor hybrid histidine kinase [Calothrix sp. NIES-2100]|uniref:PAS domain-containing protein n=1 Tax=Calothrix sp. NIES-2100 TaxID=1954172 RepID=UPI000B61CA0A|nr:PAS/PAC sensor hybrid histidine kinase [Calothrix sp. NIES-2100]
MLKVQRLQMQRYGVAILSVLMALLLGLMLERLLQIKVSPLFFAAVVFSSWYGGFFPGLVGTVLAILANNYFFTQPIYVFTLKNGSDVLELVIFSSVALLISSLNAELRTAKQASEAKLAKLQVSYRRLLETANEGIWIFDSRGQTEYVNQRLAQMLGYTIKEMIGQPIFDFVEPQVQIELDQWLEQQRHNFQEINQQFDLCLRCKDTSEIWAIVSTSPILNHKGEFSSAIAMLTDITKRKQTEVALRESEERYRSLVVATSQIVWTTDPDGQGVDIADWINYTGQSPEEVKGWGWLAALHPEDRQKTAQVWTQALQQRSIYENEYRVCGQDGIYRDFSVRGVPVLTASGKVREWVGVCTDITHSKQIQDKLREKQERLDLAQSAAKSGCFEWNIQTNVNIWSKELEALYGLKPGEFGGSYEEWARWVHPDDLAKAEADVMNSLKTGELFTDWRVIWQDGSIHWMHARAKVFYDDAGKPLRMVGINVDISDVYDELRLRKQAEFALQKSEAIAKARAQELETFMETVPAAVWIAHDPHCHYMSVNRAAYELMRLPPGSVLTATPADGEFPFKFKIQKNGQDIPPQELPMQLAGSTGEPVEAELEFVFSDEDVRSIYGKAVPLRDEDGTVRGVIGAFLDVTERKQVENALRENQERLTLALDAARMGSWDWDLQTNQTMWTPYHEMIFGYEPGNPQRTYQDWVNCVHPEDLSRVEVKVQTAMAKQQDYEDEYRVLWADGSIHWVSAFGRFQYNQQGQPIRMLGMLFEISDRKQAEAALRQRELMFRTLADTMPQIFWITQADGYHEYFNQRWYDYTGKTLEQTRGEGWQKVLHPDDVQRTIEVWQNSLHTGKTYEIEYRFLRADGEYRWHLGRAFPLRNQEGQILNWFGSCTDIHDQKLAIEERAQALERERAARIELEKASRMKDDFLAIVSHELRSPLNPILGWSTLLLNRQLNAQKTTQALEIIQRNAKLQTGLIDDLLDVSRILRGKLSLNICIVDLVATVEASLETVRLAAEAKSIHIQTKLDPTVGKVEGDPNRLQQVVVNLLTNAVKFTPSEGRIEIKLQQMGSHAQIHVTDTGKGISPDFLPYVFERFRQADEATTRKFGGLGLGLAIVRHIVELHGGSVQVTSPGEGLGATFTVTLPMMTAVAQKGENNELPSNCPNLQGLRILAVDDDVDNLDLITFILEQYGVEVTAVSSAREALKAIAKIQPDLLISDIAMPEIDGYTLIRQVRELELLHGGRLPAIALTAFAGETNNQQILAAGFQRHITKPVDPDQLATVIEQEVKYRGNG